MTNKIEQNTAEILTFPAQRATRRDAMLREIEPTSKVTLLRKPRVIVDAWYHQEAMESEASPRRN